MSLNKDLNQTMKFWYAIKERMQFKSNQTMKVWYAFKENNQSKANQPKPNQATKVSYIIK